MSAASVVEIPETHEIREISQRYRNGYEEAESTIDFGQFVKAVAVVAAVATFLGTLALSDRSAVITMAGTAAAVLLGILFYLAGIVLCSQGRRLQTTIDSAVNSSPFLTNAAKTNMILQHRIASEVTPISEEARTKAQSR